MDCANTVGSNTVDAAGTRQGTVWVHSRRSSACKEHASTVKHSRLMKLQIAIIVKNRAVRVLRISWLMWVTRSALVNTM